MVAQVISDNNEIEYGRPSNGKEDNEKISSDDDHKEKNIDQDPYRNESFRSQKEAAEYERKKANALLANPLRGYSHAELRKLGKNYALGKRS